MVKKILRKITSYVGSLPTFNYYIMSLTILISFIGVMVIFSASSNLTIKYNTGPFHYVLRHAMFSVGGVILMLVASIIDFRFYERWYAWIYIFALFLLGAALWAGPLRVFYNGYAKRGIRLIGFSFMPSDVYKIASIIFLASFLTKRARYAGEFFRGFIITLIVLSPSIMIFMQPDLSTFLVVVITLGIMYLVGGFQKKFWLPVIGLMILGVLVFYFFGKGYQMNRIRAYLDPEKYAQSISWHIIHSLYAVSRGGLFGVGYGKSVLKYGYLADEVNSDMIFAVIAEEFGFVGSLAFILLVFTLFILIIREAMKAKDLYPKLVLVGIGTLYFFQSFINIGVAINAIPNTGITLPFVSYGGTSVLIYFVMMGIVLNISRYNNMNKIEKKVSFNKKTR